MHRKIFSNNNNDDNNIVTLLHNVSRRVTVNKLLRSIDKYKIIKMIMYIRKTPLNSQNMYDFSTTLMISSTI